MAGKGGAEIEKIESFIGNVGAFGLYQKLYMALLQLQAYFYSLVFLFMSFAIMDPKYICVEEGMKNLTDTCDVLAQCSNYTIELKGGFRSLAVDWPDLITKKCDSGKFFNPLLFLISIKEIFAGIVFIFAGACSDLIGRKPMILMGTGIMILAIFGAAASNSILVFAVFYFIISLGASVKGTSASSLGNECTLSKYRLSMNFVMTWAFAYCFVSLTAFLTKNWRLMLITAGSIGIPVFFGYAFYAESPRWLLVRLKYERAAKALNRIAWVNGNKIRYTADDLRKQLEPLQPKGSQQTNAFLAWARDMKSMRGVFASKRLGLYLCFVLWHYLTAGAVSANFVVNAGEFVTNPYLSIALVGLFRIWTPFVIMGLDLYHSRFNRRVFMMGSFFAVLAPLTVSTVMSIAAEYAGEPNSGWMGTVVAICALFSTSMSYGLLFFSIYQVTVEVFPTVSRSGAISVISIASTIGGAIGPQVILLQNIWPPLHFVVGEICMIISFMVAYKVVPETKNTPLPDRFDDIKLVLAGKQSITDPYPPVVDKEIERDEHVDEPQNISL